MSFACTELSWDLTCLCNRIEHDSCLSFSIPCIVQLARFCYTYVHVSTVLIILVFTYK